MKNPLWQPSPERIAATNLVRFMDRVNARHGLTLRDYDGLWAWSVAEKERFWSALWDFCDVIAETRGRREAVDIDKLPGARYFPDARLNFAENLLRPGRRSVPDESPAMVYQGEGRDLATMSWAEMEAAVSRLAQALTEAGIGPGDRVAAYVAHLPETVIAMLAATSLGAIWSSCSPDFGVHAVLDRFGQIEPKLLFAVDGYSWEGKRFDTLGRLPEIIDGLPSLERVIVIPNGGARPDLSHLPMARSLDEAMAAYAPRPIRFASMGFNDPLYIMFSSGTTGPPKCILHGIGGTLLQHLKEHRLHCDVHPGERVFYFTTCGWMMWNWQVSALASQATLVLYDGSPFHPDGNRLFDLADRARITLLGVSAKLLDAVAKAGLKPRETHDLSTVRLITSTGSPLAPEGFDFVYRDIKADVHLASVSGGTDIIACFVAGNPIGPVWRGEIQARALAMAVDVFDDDGRPIRGEKGELVCTGSFPSMPLGFWHDPDGGKYHDAYFARFPNTWCHGDYVALTEHGGIIMYGRSDAVLNPGGVRIGTAEIYRQVERVDEVLEALVIGQDWRDDTRVVLFVRLRDGAALDDALRDRIKAQIRDNASPRHVPARILQVADIPRTKSGKIVELAVRDVVHGRPVKNQDALANPEALDLFRDRPELKA